MQPITVSLSELREFILKQEDSRLVNPMNGVADSKECLCILAHYCREKEIPFTNCLFTCAYVGMKTTLSVGEGKSLLHLFSCENQNIICDYKIISYGDLKALLK